jgi:Asp-tRNA(Asn)/Glu-tRNA(Gln) amidotransferase A subunit family amidase
MAALRQDPQRIAMLTPYTRSALQREIENPTLLEYALSIRPSVRNRAIDRLEDVFARYDLVACPTISCTPFVANDPRVTWQSYTAHTVIVNIAGYAGCSIPAGFVQGLPIGLQLFAPPQREKLLLRAARAIEQARPWLDIHPPIC